jgi:hypothetical protein
MATKTHDPLRKSIDAWLVAHKVGQYVTSVRFNANRGTYRAFLCTYWKHPNRRSGSGNILQFNGHSVTLIDTSEGKEEIVDQWAW